MVENSNKTIIIEEWMIAEPVNDLYMEGDQFYDFAQFQNNSIHYFLNKVGLERTQEVKNLCEHLWVTHRSEEEIIEYLNVYKKSNNL